MICDYCKKEIVKNCSGFVEQELTSFLFKRFTGLTGDNRLGNYFVCDGLSCMVKEQKEKLKKRLKNQKHLKS